MKSCILCAVGLITLIKRNTRVAFSKWYCWWCIQYIYIHMSMSHYIPVPFQLYCIFLSTRSTEFYYVWVHTNWMQYDDPKYVQL
jgi:hypothetical protein